MKLAVIGGGAMGEAMVSGLLTKGVLGPDDVVVSDVVEARRAYLRDRYQVNTNDDNRKAVQGVDGVILAIKPQNLAGVLSGLSGGLASDQVCLSIVAGATLRTLSTGLTHRRVVRIMPNTPAQIGEGMSVWTTTADVTEAQKGMARTILQVLGQEVYVEDEGMLDMATAVSGSGPAYFFLFMEALVAAAQHVGLPEALALRLVTQTALGSVRLAQTSDRSLAELRTMVTSPGGTTAAALGRFEANRFREIVAEAVEAAFRRSRELGGVTTA